MNWESETKRGIVQMRSSCLLIAASKVPRLGGKLLGVVRFFTHVQFSKYLLFAPGYSDPLLYVVAFGAASAGVSWALFKPATNWISSVVG